MKTKMAQANSAAERMTQMPKAKLVQMKRTSPEVAENRLEETSVERGATSKKSKRGRPFERGNQFGKGRPKGSPNKKSSLARQILDEQAPEIVLAIAEFAKKGDRTAMTLCMERLIPPVKDQEESAEQEPIKLEIEWV